MKEIDFLKVLKRNKAENNEFYKIKVDQKALTKFKNKILKSLKTQNKAK